MTTAARGCVKGRGSYAGAERRLWLIPRELGDEAGTNAFTPGTRKLSSACPAAKDLAGVTGDVAVLEWVRDRIARTLDAAGRSEIDSGLRELRAATDARNLPAAADHAARLGAQLRGLTDG
jgi:hypothetical protein